MKGTSFPSTRRSSGGIDAQAMLDGHGRRTAEQPHGEDARVDFGRRGCRLATASFDQAHEDRST